MQAFSGDQIPCVLVFFLVRAVTVAARALRSRLFPESEMLGQLRLFLGHLSHIGE